MGYVVGGCNVYCSCYTEHGRYGLSCLHAETVEYSATLHAYTKKDTRPSSILLQAARSLKPGNYAQSALRPLTSLEVVVTMETVCVCFCIVSCPHPTQLTQGEGVWCYKSLDKFRNVKPTKLRAFIGKCRNTSIDH